MSEDFVLITPVINERYWIFKVSVSDNQAIVGFSKFCTIGIGFQHEKDWNTNLPYTSKAEDIYEHIKHNKSCKARKARCIQAIRDVQDMAKKYMFNQKANEND